LRNAQFNARFKVQDERIQDLEQQLSSLYTAFHLMFEERSEELKSQALLKSNLDEADAQVARQVSHMGSNVTPSPASLFTPDSENEKEQAISPGGTTFITACTVSPSSIESPSGSRPNVNIVSPTTPSSSASRLATTVLSSPPVFREGDRIVAGVLLVRSSNSLLKRWKKRHAVLYTYTSHYQLDFGEGKNYSLHSNVSKVDVYSKQPYAFIIYVNAFDNNALVIHAATTNEKSFHQWLSALSLATTGLPFHKAKINHARSPKVPSLAEQEASALEKALEESTRDFSASQSESDNHNETDITRNGGGGSIDDNDSSNRKTNGVERPYSKSESRSIESRG
jgi:hypothetical protein